MASNSKTTSMKVKHPNNIKIISIQVTPKKPDTEKNLDFIVEHLRFIIIAQSLIGLSRVYLFNNRKITLLISYTYSATLVFSALYFNFVIHNDVSSTSYNIVRVTSCIEFAFLVTFSILAKKNCFKNFFKDLGLFDITLNISDDLHITSPKIRMWMWIVVSLSYSTLEFVLALVFVPQFFQDHSFIWTYIALIAKDAEQVMFCTLLRMVLMRVIILKAYVVKTFSPDANGEKLSEVQALSNKAQFDISSLHRNYELLHKCAEQLNSIMSLPVNH